MMVMVVVDSLEVHVVEEEIISQLNKQQLKTLLIIHPEEVHLMLVVVNLVVNLVVKSLMLLLMLFHVVNNSLIDSFNLVNKFVKFVVESNN